MVSFCIREVSPCFAQEEDIDSWMKMVEVVKDEFPGLETLEELENYKGVVVKNINRHTAICVKDKNHIIGALLFSYNSNCLSWMAVHPNYRRKGVGCALMTKMIELFPNEANISVTTFREGDVKGVAPRKLYKKFNFLEGELVEEFNYPNQVLTLKIEK